MESEKITYDCIIVGGGAAGLTASIYTSRRGMKTLLISPDIGGQAATTNEIENYPGVGLIDGPTLMNKFKEQSESVGTKFLYAEVISIVKSADEKGLPIFTVTTNTESFVSYTVILAFGLSHRHLGVPGETEFAGKGVSYCATCDAPFFKNKNVAVVGGGNSAVDAALLLAQWCPKVYLIHRTKEFKAEAVLVEQLKQPNIEILLDKETVEIKGDQRVKSIVVRDVNNPEQVQELPLDGVFVEIGFIANTKWLQDLVEFDERKQIKVNRDCETSQPGVLAAGDVTTISYKQIVISAGEGATAALKTYSYLQKARGFRGVNIDWGLKKSPTPIATQIGVDAIKN